MSSVSIQTSPLRERKFGSTIMGDTVISSIQAGIKLRLRFLRRPLSSSPHARLQVAGTRDATRQRCLDSAAERADLAACSRRNSVDSALASRSSPTDRRAMLDVWVARCGPLLITKQTRSCTRWLLGRITCLLHDGSGCGMRRRFALALLPANETHRIAILHFEITSPPARRSVRVLYESIHDAT